MTLPLPSRELIQRLQRGGLKVELDHKAGFVYRMEGFEPAYLEKLLLALERIGFLHSRVEDNTVLVDLQLPERVSVRCPECHSPDITKSELLQHIPCGTIQPSEAFIRDGRLFCPICNREAKQDEFWKAGSWYSCNSCGAKFSTPAVSFHVGDRRIALGDEIISKKRSFELTHLADGFARLVQPPLVDQLSDMLYGPQEIFFIGSRYPPQRGMTEIEAFAGLEKRPRQVVLLSAEDDISYQEISSVLESLASDSYDLAGLVLASRAEKEVEKHFESKRIPVLKAASVESVREALRQLLGGAPADEQPAKKQSKR